MALFYLTGTSSSGKRSTQAVEADSLGEAQQALLDQGWTEIVAHTDDITAVHQIEIPDNPLSAEEMVRIGRMTAFEYFWFMFRKLETLNPMLNIVGAIFLVWGVTQHRWGSLAIGSVILSLPTVLAANSSFGNRAKRRYDALLTAANWYRWDDVERLLPLQSPAISPEEIGYRGAQVRVSRGDLPGALRHYKEAIAGHNVPQWFSLARRAALHSMATRVSWVSHGLSEASHSFESPLIDESIRLYQESADLAPDQPAPKIDLAKVILKYRRDKWRACKLLDAAQELPSAELTIVYLTYVRGIVAIEENLPDEAIHCITEFQQTLSRLGVNPEIDAAIDESRLFLTLAFALAGQDENARKQFRRCEPRMIAVHELELLARCREALGLTGRSR